MKCPRCSNNVPEESSFCMHCGRSLLIGAATDTHDISGDFMEDSLLTFDPGESFGERYKINRELGRGGMGRVYEAEDRDLGITVALKMIHPVFLSNEKMVERFKKEILLARQITHHNVVRIHDFGEVQKAFLGQIQRIKFITMQFVDGNNLKEIVLKSSALEIEWVINIFIQICKGLRSAHQGGIIHRDLKPQNIMVDENDKVYITDFGLAKSLEGPELSASGSPIGTPEYISPEQANGEKADRRSDIYNLGLILYEMVTGRRVYNAETVVGFLQKHMKEKPAPPSRFNPKISISLENIIMKCLSKDPDKRYQDADELLNILKDFRGNGRSFIPPYIVKRIRKYAMWSLLLVPLFGLFLLTRGAWVKLTLPSVSLEKRAPIAVLAFENNTGDKEMDYWQKALPDLLQSDISQSKYFRVLSEERIHGILTGLKLNDAVRFSPDNLREIADRGQVDHVITGSYVRGGRRLQINVKILEPKRGHAVETISVSGASQESVFSMINQVTREIKRRFGLTPYEITADLDKDVEHITTKSPKALQYYIEGKQLHWEGDFNRSIEKLEQAIKLDSELTMAYFRMSENYSYLGYPEKSQEYIKKALMDLERVPDREKFYIQGFAAIAIDNSYLKAKHYYEEWLKIYPDDEEANGLLGAIYRNAEEWEKSMVFWEKILQVNNQSIGAIDNLFSSLLGLGEYDKAHYFLQSNEHHFTDKSFFHYEMSWGYLCQGKLDYALVELEKAIALDESSSDYILFRGKIHLLRGDFEGAKNDFVTIINHDQNEMRVNGYYWRAQLANLKGRFDKNIEYLEKGVEESIKNKLNYDTSDFLLREAFLKFDLKDFSSSLTLSRRAINLAQKYYYPETLIQGMFLKILSLLQFNDSKIFDREMKEFKEYIESKLNQKYLRFYLYLLGASAEKKLEFDTAMKNFRDGYVLISEQNGSTGEHGLFLNAMAQCSYKNNDLDNAILYYESILKLTAGRLLWGNIYAKSFYYLGKISQKKGWEGKAIDFYKRFLDLWKEADPSFSEILDAKAQLKLLEN